MTEPNPVVGEMYRIVYNNHIPQEEIFGIFKEKQCRPYIPHQYIKSISVEPDYEITIDYLFMGDDTVFRVEDWEMKYGLVDIYSMEVPIK